MSKTTEDEKRKTNKTRDAEREALARVDALIAETIRSELAKWAPVVAWFVRKAVDPRGFTDDPRDTRFRYCN